MNLRVGIWIDRRKAVIVSAAADLVTSLTLESEHRHDRHLERYFDQVVDHLGKPDALLIIGPGEAKIQFNEHLSRSKALPACLIEIETTDTLTDPQIIAKVRKHYDIAAPCASSTRDRSGVH
jgi:hypothetical protein